MTSTRHLLMVTAACILIGVAGPVQHQAAAQTEKTPSAKALQKKAITGTVTDSAGKPLSGATVEFWSNLKDPSELFDADLNLIKTVKTTKSGTFELAATNEVGIIVAKKKGLAPAWRTVSVAYGVGQQGALSLGIPSAVEGTLVDTKGKPVARATVFVSMGVASASKGMSQSFNFIAGTPAREMYSVKTDGAGRFRIANLPADLKVMFEVDIPGKAIRQGSVNFNALPHMAGQKDIKLVVEDTGCVQGKVAFDGTAPINLEVTVSAKSDNYFISRTSKTKPVKVEKNGSFEIKNVAPGQVRISAVFGKNKIKDWVAEGASVVVSSGKTNRDVQIKATRGGILEVKVVDQETRKPLADAMVSIYNNNATFQETGKTGTNGIYLCRLPAGEYRASARHESSQGFQNDSIKLENGQTNRMEIEIIPPCVVTGVVRNPDGTPAKGLEVSMFGTYVGQFQVKTDADGKFELKINNFNIPGNRSTQCAVVRDVSRNLCAAQEIEEDTKTLDLKLAPGLTLVGKAERQGKPVTNVTAQLIFWTGNSGMHLNLALETNAPGCYEIPALPLGRRYGVVVSAPGYGQKTISEVPDTSEAGRVTLDTVELSPANLKLAGQVVDADEKPVAGANVHLSGEDQPSASAITDSEGHFEFSNVCEGVARLWANSQRDSGNASAEGGETNVVIQLGRTQSFSSGAKANKLSGIVTDGEGKTVSEASVAVFPPENGVQWKKANAEGKYDLKWSLPSWRSDANAFAVARDKSRDLAVTAEIPEGTTNLNIKLAPAMAISGRVNKPDGTPLPGATIRLQFSTGNNYNYFEEAELKTDEQGKYEYKCLPMDGKYLVCVSASGYGEKDQHVQNDAETNHFEVSVITLKLANQEISGIVVDENEKPVSGVYVSLNGDDQPSGSMTTEANGRFKFKVCEGQVRLFASANSSFNQAEASSGDTNVVITLTKRSSSSDNARPRRVSLNGKPLPDLATVNLAKESLPENGAVLVCLFDAAQRPSRHVVTQLKEKTATLKEKGITVVAIQASITTDETFDTWKTSSAVTFPVGRVTDKSEKSKWASSNPSLPSFILTDAKRLVISEGFSFADLDDQVKKLTK